MINSRNLIYTNILDLTDTKIKPLHLSYFSDNYNLLNFWDNPTFAKKKLTKLSQPLTTDKMVSGKNESWDFK